MRANAVEGGFRKGCRLVVAGCLLQLFSVALAAQSTTDWVNKYWDASWIDMPGKSGREYGVYHFRKTFQLDTPPDSFVVRVSADSRYRLFVNGNLVGAGPAQGTPQNWFYDTYDIARFLRRGGNTIAAQVWNYGEGGPWVQMSVHTAFVLQGGSEREKIVNTDAGWKVSEDKAYSILPIDPVKVPEFIIVTPGDSIDANKYPWGWEQPGYDDSGWRNAVAFVKGAPYATGTDLWWQLVPREVPYLVEDTVRFMGLKRVRAMGDPRDPVYYTKAAANLLRGEGVVSIPAHAHVRLLFDKGTETTSFPELITGGGKNAVLTLSYAEALKDRQRVKGNRDSLEGKELYGVADKFVADGGDRRLFRPLWFRSFRFLELDIVTGDQPLTICDLYAKYNHVSRPQTASFETSDPLFNRILQTAWRTQDLCTKDYLLTDAYYEQLQYIGDNRIQALILNSMGYDRALVKNMIRQYFMSRTSEGLTQSRYPCAVPQVIPTYSLLWISMVHDYWKYYKDDAFIRQMLSGVHTILDWYESKWEPATGLLGKTEYFNFVDWTREWAWDNFKAIGGVPAGVEQGGSSITTMQWIYALDDAADLFDHYGKKQEAAGYRKKASVLRQNVWDKCWDKKRQLLADTPDKTVFSQHANIFGVLSNTIPSALQASVLRRINKDTSLIQCSLYFRFYLGQAFIKAGLSEEYLDLMDPWKVMLADGLTTFAEVPGNAARSDCHPWSCSPLYEYYSTVCGIRPAAPGFSKISIRPAMGPLKWIKATMIQGGQPLQLDLRKRGNSGIEGSVLLPEGIEAEFIWKGQKVVLHKGGNAIRL
ncbi:MAG: alpha-L-rhamnosidase N-terminal domain-containing protein [Puia sp.]|nr:alpha-L-rhamnosidase N-terminal domain-containing protein [Puia sp.]